MWIAETNVTVSQQPSFYKFLPFCPSTDNGARNHKNV